MLNVTADEKRFTHKGKKKVFSFPLQLQRECDTVEESHSGEYLGQPLVGVNF